MPFTTANQLAKRAHPIEHAMHFAHYVNAVEHDRLVGAIAQSRMQHASILGEVNAIAGKHAVAMIFYFTVFGLNYFKIEAIVYIKD